MYRHSVRLILAGLACAALGCSPKAVAGDASAGVDAVDPGVVDSLGDLDGGGGEGLADAVGDATSEVDANNDAISDAITELAEVDTAPIALDCAADATPATADGFVLTDVGPLIPNPVFTGCAKGKPEPVAQPTQCGCDCPPPYSCYCNGECAWLRTPDPHVSHLYEPIVWTGKWVVTMAEYYVGQDKGMDLNVTVVERWNPASTGGFELIDTPVDYFKPLTGYIGPDPRLLAAFGNIVALGMPYGHSIVSKGNLPPSYNPKNPVHLLDVEAKKWSQLQMPNCEKLRATKTHLGCIEPGPNKGTVHLYEVATQKWSTTKVPQALVPAGTRLLDTGATGWYFADQESFYYIDAIYQSDEYPWPDGSVSADGSHILRYHVPTGVWSDVGTMPKSWKQYSIGLLGNGLVRFPFPERLDFASKKITVGPPGYQAAPDGSYLKGVHVECGLFIPSTYGPKSPGTLWGRPVILKHDLTIQLVSPWGYPHDGRNAASAVATDTEIISLGGGSFPAPHIDSYRFPLSQVCKGASQ